MESPTLSPGLSGAVATAFRAGAALAKQQSMRRSAWLGLDVRPLAHPVWWLALALLVCNDHLFKGRGILPGWLTGKLSDVAFLIVAPVLAAVVLPRTLPRRRAVALFLVGGVFAAAKASSAASDALVAMLGHIGLRWRLWPDATDLLALAVLPVAGWVLRQHREDCGRDSRRRPIRAWLGLAAGALACAATSAPPTYLHQPFLLNAGPSTTTVTVTWILPKISCLQKESGEDSMVSPDAATTLAQTLTSGDLDVPRTMVLARGQVAALDGAPPAGVSPVGTCKAQTTQFLGTCVGAVLQADAAPPVLMVGPAHWTESDGGAFFSCQNPPSPVSLCSPTMDPAHDAGPDAVTLKMVGGSLTFVAGARVALAPIDLGALAARVAPPQSCGALKQQYESLLQPQPCAVDTDCVGISDLPIPGPSARCGIATNLQGASAIDGLGTQWDATCTASSSESCATAPQPAVCRAGTCAVLCPGESIPTCPGPCGANEGWPGAACSDAGSGTPCTRSDGLVCNCVNGRIGCGPAQAVSATCPMPCNDWPGGGTYVDGRVIHPYPGLDGGVASATAPAAADGGSIDALATDASVAPRPDAGAAGQ